MAPRESQKRASLKWDKENMATLSCKIRKKQAAAFKAYCSRFGKSANTLLKEFVLTCIATPEAGAEQNAEKVLAALEIPDVQKPPEAELAAVIETEPIAEQSPAENEAARLTSLLPESEQALALAVLRRLVLAQDSGKIEEP